MIFSYFSRGKPTAEKFSQNVTSENFSVLDYTVPTCPRSHRILCVKKLEITANFSLNKFDLNFPPIFFSKKASPRRVRGLIQIF